VPSRTYPAAIAAVLFFVLPSSVTAAAGDLDTGFSGDGKVSTNLTSGIDYTVGMVIRPDGKIVTAGPAAGKGGRFSLVRYNANGTRDGTFGTKGVVFTNFTKGGDLAYDLALQADGKLIAVGKAAGGGGRFALARYRPNGRLDTTFSGDGKLMTNLTAGNDYAYNVAVQTDGKIVVVGGAGGGGGRFAIVRYKPNGMLDRSFSGDGKAFVNLTPGSDYADDVALGSGGAVLVAGAANFGPSGSLGLVRLVSDGTLDTTFDGDGKLIMSLTSGLDAAWGVAIQADEKIVAVGPAAKNMGVVRFDSAGAPDPTFGPSANGEVIIDFTAGTDLADEVALDSAGRIVVVGVASLNTANASFALARLTDAGILDSTFSAGGKLTTNLTGKDDYAADVQLTPGTGTIVAGGFGADGGRSAIVRYLAG
jgi:uncharacterized delta-60 repeat protein